MSGCRVKLCGMSREVDLDAVVAAQPDYVGFVVDFPRSRRSVSPDRLPGLVAYLRRREEERGHGSSKRIVAVGVFVDEPPERLAEIAVAAGLDAVQLHGHEDEAHLAELRGLLPEGTLVIQAFRVREPADVARAEASSADLVLLDNGQGTGERFDWSLVRGVSRPFLLAGGLTPENLPEAVRELRPFGVDLSSGIETDGCKDPTKIAAAVRAVRATSP